MAVKTKRRPVEDAELDMTPMIDCTFQLLIFFLLTSKMTPVSDIKLPEAIHGEKAVLADSVIITVGKASDGTGSIFLADDTDPKHRASGTPEEQEKAIMEYIKRELAKIPQGQTQRNHVLIKAAGDLKEREVARVARAVSRTEAEIGNLYLGVSEQ